MKTMADMTAAALRAAGLLWPECLTDAELERELARISHDTGPITRRMLTDEQQRRRTPHKEKS